MYVAAEQINVEVARLDLRRATVKNLTRPFIDLPLIV